VQKEVEPNQPASRPWHEFKHWQSLSDGFLVSIVVVGPTFLFSELWRGKPLIDRGPSLWVPAALIMAAGFFAGGAIAGRHRSTAKGAFNQGILVAGLTLTLIFLADMIRRIVLGQDIYWGVLGYWVAATAAGLLLSGLAGVCGRIQTVRAVKRSRMNRFF